MEAIEAFCLLELPKSTQSLHTVAEIRTTLEIRSHMLIEAGTKLTFRKIA